VKKFLTIIIILLISAFSLKAQVYDSLYLASVRDSVKRYFEKHPPKTKFKDIKISPHTDLDYTKEDGVSLIAGFVAPYKNNLNLPQTSFVGIIGKASTKKTFFIGIAGWNYSPSGKFFTSYNIKTGSRKRYFWGTGFENAQDDSNKTLTKIDDSRCKITVLYTIKNHHIGIIGGYDYFSINPISDTIRTAINTARGFNRKLSLGVLYKFSNLDEENNPSKGISFEASALTYRFNAVFDAYLNIWKGGILYTDIYQAYTIGHPSWFLWPSMGSGDRMQVYYQGKYIDRHLICTVVGIRQLLYKNHTIILSIGAGNIFPSLDKFNIKNTLPTYGIGYRVKIYNTMLKIDLGLGKSHEHSIRGSITKSF